MRRILNLRPYMAKVLSRYLVASMCKHVLSRLVCSAWTAFCCLINDLERRSHAWEIGDPSLMAGKQTEQSCCPSRGQTGCEHSHAFQDAQHTALLVARGHAGDKAGCCHLHKRQIILHTRTGEHQNCLRPQLQWKLQLQRFCYQEDHDIYDWCGASKIAESFTERILSICTISGR